MATLPPSQLKHVTSRGFTVKLSLDTSGRKGKAVTVLDGLPKSELFLKELTQILKKKCGAGGTYLTSGKDGVVEIQGDQRPAIRKFLESEGILIKG
jgi:translation initiation factor 1